MDLKTCTLALSTMFAPMASQAQKVMPRTTAKRLGVTAEVLQQFNPDTLVSYKNAQHAQGVVAKTIADMKTISYADAKKMSMVSDTVSDIKKASKTVAAEFERTPNVVKRKPPLLYRKPKPANADKRIGNYEYDDLGYINKIYKNNKLSRTISRSEDGKLMEYSDISYKANGKKDTESLYMLDENNSIIKLADHVYNDNGTVLVNEYNLDGEVVYKRLHKTRQDGDDLLPGRFIREIPID